MQEQAHTRARAMRRRRRPAVSQGQDADRGQDAAQDAAASTSGDEQAGQRPRGSRPQHALLLGHRAAELAGRARRLAERADIGGGDRGERRRRGPRPGCQPATPRPSRIAVSDTRSGTSL